MCTSLDGVRRNNAGVLTIVDMDIHREVSEYLNVGIHSSPKFLDPSLENRG